MRCRASAATSDWIPRHLLTCLYVLDGHAVALFIENSHFIGLCRNDYIPPTQASRQLLRAEQRRAFMALQRDLPQSTQSKRNIVEPGRR